ncbi:MAG: tRNA pseudouridine(13) synthase TruD, partial [Psychrobacter sp.]|nr:tRNA pseudouridine(13) synthase TruD [Psychrobacter sp.]
PAKLPILQATYKVTPETFIVNEQMDIDFTGEGEHLWVLIKKTGMNTGFVANLLADWAGIPARDVGYSGLKDRQAVTTQWFSLRIPNRTLPDTPFHPALKDFESIEVVEQHWHNKKLNRGTHKFNQFILILSEVQLDSLEAVEYRLQQIRDLGVPNYFGTQRFGHYGNNIKEALRWFDTLLAATSNSGSLARSNDKRNKNKRINKREREQQSMWISAARSLIFNRILDTRVRNTTWDSGLAGDAFNLDGTGSIFCSNQIDDELVQRLLLKDIHPTGLLWGIGEAQTSGAAAQLERQLVCEDGLLSQLARGIEAQGVKSQRRSLRLVPKDMRWRWIDTQSLELKFSLPSGSYATGVLYSLVKRLELS